METATYLEQQQYYEEKLEKWLKQMFLIFCAIRTDIERAKIFINPQFLRYAANHRFFDKLFELDEQTILIMQNMWEELHEARQEAAFMEDAE